MPTPALHDCRLLSVGAAPEPGLRAPVRLLSLEMPDCFHFEAGQYLEIALPEGSIPLSIASAPWRLPRLELHYRSTPGAPEAAQLDTLLEHAGTSTTTLLKVRGPLGSVRLSPPLTQPLLLIAGGTGAAQAMSIIDTLTRQVPVFPVTLLWCADEPDDFYLEPALRALDAAWLELQLIADAERSDANRGLDWLRRNAARFAGTQVVLAGSPAFVYRVCDLLETQGVPLAALRSDVFDYAPRS
ncbi:MAG: hypothetical protein R3E86_12125 [Pseudomonadales bacterium]